MLDGALALVVAFWVVLYLGRVISGRSKESVVAVGKPLPKNSAYKAPRHRIISLISDPYI